MAVLRAPGSVRGACSHLGRAHHRRQELRPPPVLGAHRQPHHDSRGVDVALPAWRRGGVAAGQDCAARAGQRVHRFHRLYRRSLRTPVSLCDRRPRRHTRWGWGRGAPCVLSLLPTTHAPCPACSGPVLAAFNLPSGVKRMLDLLISRLLTGRICLSDFNIACVPGQCASARAALRNAPHRHPPNA